jgi:hypothetical protein
MNNIDNQILDEFLEALSLMGVNDERRRNLFLSHIKSGKLSIKAIKVIIELKSVNLRNVDKLALTIALIEGKVTPKYINELIEYNDIQGLKDAIDFYVQDKKTEYFNKYVLPKINMMEQVAIAISGKKPAPVVAPGDNYGILKSFGFSDQTIELLKQAVAEGRMIEQDVKFIVQTIEDPKIPIDAKDMETIVSVFNNPQVNMEIAGIIIQGLSDGTLANEEIEGLTQCIIKNKIDDVFGFIYDLSKEQRAEKIMEFLFE